jgi:hypothetical protein
VDLSREKAAIKPLTILGGETRSRFGMPDLAWCMRAIGREYSATSLTPARQDDRDEVDFCEWIRLISLHVGTVKKLFWTEKLTWYVLLQYATGRWCAMFMILLCLTTCLHASLAGGLQLSSTTTSSSLALWCIKMPSLLKRLKSQTLVIR